MLIFFLVMVDKLSSLKKKEYTYKYKAKSQVFISKHLHRRGHFISSSLGIPLGTARFTYLGVPIFHGKPRVPYFQSIVIRSECVSLAGWNLCFQGQGDFN